ncbi:M48 family metallopeptidase [Sphingomonas sp. GCM10030256]|uniref:M48 family metallopeptidase n=1 Tax=Sphingomonas sp. GCM10030256 TaxID=3273427 RepID=UPI00360D0661
MSGILSTATFEVAGLSLPVVVRRYRSARRMRMRVDHHAGLIRLSVPSRVTERAALRWAGSQGAWITEQLQAAPPAIAFDSGALIPFEGADLSLRWAPERRRGVIRVEQELIVGGPRDGFARQVERWLQAQARDTLSTLTAETATLAGVSVRSVSIGDPVSRWGSCSSSGNIRYSWRLILAPPPALRFVVAHEVAHRLHMDHSPAFKAAEERLFGGPVAPARALLRELAPALRAIGQGR